MPALTNPIIDPQGCDTVTIGGVVSPGLAKINEFKTKREFDIKKGKGTFGATITFVGRPPSTGSITFYLWEAAHFDAWSTFRDQFKFDPTKKAIQAIDIFHPSLSEIDMNSFVCEGISAWKHEGKGLYSIDVDLLEYFPPPAKNATGTPSGSKSDGKGTSKTGKSDDPIADAQQAEIKKLLGEANA